MDTVTSFRTEVCERYLGGQKAAWIAKFHLRKKIWTMFLLLNLQLNAVVNSKLPVSRAKMASITKLAIKSMKVSLSKYSSDIAPDKLTSEWVVEYNYFTIHNLMISLSPVLQAHCYDRWKIYFKGKCVCTTVLRCNIMYLGASKCTWTIFFSEYSSISLKVYRSL